MSSLQSVASAGETGDFERWWQSEGVWVEAANQRRGGESGVQRLKPLVPGGPTLYCKRQTGHLFYSLLHPFGRPTALRELQAYRAYAQAGVNVPRLVYGATRRHQGQWQALLVTEELTGFVSLDEWYLKHARDTDSQVKAALLEQVAVMLARLHRARWQHGCCYPKHVFVRVTPRTDAQPLIETAMLDLEKSRRRWRTRDASFRDLRQLRRHRGQIPERDLDYLQQIHHQALKGDGVK